MLSCPGRATLMTSWALIDTSSTASRRFRFSIQSSFPWSTKERSQYVEAFRSGLSPGASAAVPAAFVLLHNATLLKDFCNSGLINFSPVHPRHPSVSLHPACHFSSPFVKLWRSYTWQYRLQRRSAGAKRRGEWWGVKGRRCDKTRCIERRRERESVLPRNCQPFYYRDACAFITVPANKNLLKPMGRQLYGDLAEWHAVLNSHLIC